MDSTLLITYIHYFKSLKKSQKLLRYHNLMGFTQKGRRRPQKRKDSCFFLNLGTSTYATGTKFGTLWKWIFLDLWWFFRNFMTLGCSGSNNCSCGCAYIKRGHSMLTKLLHNHPTGALLVIRCQLGKCHLKLNIGKRPIVNKYHEGKMKRTLLFWWQ